VRDIVPEQAERQIIIFYCFVANGDVIDLVFVILPFLLLMSPNACVGENRGIDLTVFGRGSGRFHRPMKSVPVQL